MYYFKDGKYVSPREKRICTKCGEKKEIQVGSDICDDCIGDETIKKLVRGYREEGYYG